MSITPLPRPPAFANATARGPGFFITINKKDNDHDRLS
jgi:hypothetical protein